ncbi:MAG TPA: cache domain-containing protein, partial [Aggregatilineaceae bacterium]|nr:cache domain-containing protein [Aggregatilineaceae bacterium]
MTTKLEAQRPPAAAPLTGLLAWRQLRWNLLVAFVGLAVLPIAIFAGISLPRMRNQVRQPVVNQLESVAELKTQEAARWLATGEAALELLYAGRNQRDRFILLATANMPSDVQVNTINSAFVDAVNTHAGFREFFLYDVQGHVLASSNSDQIGQDVTQQPYFETSLTGRHVQPPYYEANTNELIMIITRPVQDNSSRLVGVLAGRLDLETLARIMTERTGLGTSGETYLVSVQGNYLLTPSRFTGYEPIRAYHSLGIDRALAGQEGSATYKN